MYQLFARKFWTEDSVPIHLEFRNPQPPFPLHGHDFYEFAVVYNGTGVQVSEHGSTDLQEGHVICVKPGQIHGYKKIDNLILMNILTRPHFFDGNTLGLNQLAGYQALFEPLTENRARQTAITVVRLNRFQLFEVQAIIESIKHETAGRNLGGGCMINLLTIQLFVYLLRVFDNKNFSSSVTDTTATALVAYMEKNYRNKISMKDLTSFSGLSESSVLRLFKRMTGFSPFTQQNRLRLFEATNLLAGTNKSITDIAFQVGFDDSNYFCRSFRNFIHLSPGEYRKQFQKTGL